MTSPNAVTHNIGMHKLLVVFPVTPPVARCACGAKVTRKDESTFREHLATGAHGKFFPWAEPSE